MAFRFPGLTPAMLSSRADSFCLWGGAVAGWRAAWPSLCRQRDSSGPRRVLSKADFNSSGTPKIDQLGGPSRLCSGGQECPCDGQPTPSA